MNGKQKNKQKTTNYFKLPSSTNVKSGKHETWSSNMGLWRNMSAGILPAAAFCSQGLFNSNSSSFSKMSLLCRSITQIGPCTDRSKNTHEHRVLWASVMFLVNCGFLVITLRITHYRKSASLKIEAAIQTVPPTVHQKGNLLQRAKRVSTAAPHFCYC